jgi:radical SAM superfamily enzyme YgiQ (UPF0313 family)
MRPGQIASWLETNAWKMDLSVQYLGDEPNALRRIWDNSSLRWLVCASWPYEHAAGNQSIPAVCKAVTDASPRYLADRFYLPATPRDMRLLERADVPVFGIESKHQLREFDVVGTSISYLVLLMNFCKMLDMSGVPMRWRDRQEDPGSWPMIIIGGQAYSAPAAMEPVADCLWLGEAETEPGNGGMAAVCARIEQFRKTGLWRSNRVLCYEKLALEFSYLHFPRFVETSYRYEDRGLEHPSKCVSGYRSLLPGMIFPRRARKVRDMNKTVPLTAAPLLYADPALGAGDLEVARGCPAWCSFCRLSWVTKPYRQRDVALSVEHAAAWHRNMGAVELSPFAPDFPMHTQRKELIARLLEVNDEADSVAMRVDDFIADGDFMLVQALGGMDAVTLGLEGNSQRMRDLVGKGTSDQEVIEAVTRGIRAGIRKFKLFMITALPGEEPGDVMKIVDLGRRLAAVRDELGQPNVRIQLSWTPLLIEASTPFQWFAPTPPDHTLIKVADLLRGLKIDFKIGVKAEPNKLALFQLCQRASAEIGEAVIDVIAGYGIACWGGVPKDMQERLEEAMRAHGFDNGLADAFDERYYTDLFGWEYIDTGVSRELMWNVYRQMVEFLEETDADTYDEQFSGDYHGQEWVARCDTQCMGNRCGVCSKDDLQLRRNYILDGASESSVNLSRVRPVDQSSVAQKVLFQISRPERYRFVGNDHWRFSVRRAAYQVAHIQENTLPSGFSIAKRSIRFASDGMDDRGVYGTDYVEFGLTRELDGVSLASFMSGMCSMLSPWLKLEGLAPDPEAQTWRAMPPSASLRRETGAHCFTVPVAGVSLDLFQARLNFWAKAEYIKLTLRRETAYFGLGTEDVNALDYVDDMWVISDGAALSLRMIARGPAGPYQLLAALLGKPGWIGYLAQGAIRHEVYTPGSTGSAAIQGDLLSPACSGCGRVIPVGLSGSDPDVAHCPSCWDAVLGRRLAALPLRTAV